MSENARIAKLQAQVKADGSDERAHYLLGQEYFGQGRYIEAATEFRRTVEINPEYASAWFHLGVACEKAQDYKEALSSYRQAVAVAEYAQDAALAGRARSRLGALES
jgi:superkiller protein 3